MIYAKGYVMASVHGCPEDEAAEIVRAYCREKGFTRAMAKILRDPEGGLNLVLTRAVRWETGGRPEVVGDGESRDEHLQAVPACRVAFAQSAAAE